ncbi:GntR family transcriptional regulator [Devosia sp. YIM 151766]|uniref:GntR family transcriptional regulator n=1 Tax=Devosia sp. YIM 151766 TaxID=3017325 RepID=UPI00255C8E2D|nr:GntR family transcriptional regulator [Devosia sp. YIM 151766]WIY54065.1 GntR family transcriptional regulator [Devosia sp. YIM 151766]
MDSKALPKYQAVHDEVLNRLEAGMYSVGTRLPTEDALAKAFDVSRVTVRKALDMLVQTGYVTARQGSGYVVSTLSPPSTTCLVSFTDQVIREGRMPGAKLLGIEAPAKMLPPDVAALFDGDVTLIRRLRTVDGKPVMLVRTWVPSHLVAGINAADLPESGQDQSILRILVRRFKMQWSRACEVISSLIADAEVAELLAVQPNTPILSQACTAFDEQQKPVFYDQVYRQSPITYNLDKAAPNRSAGQTAG